MHVELDEYDRALDAVVEGVGLARAADPAEMRLAQVTLEFLQARLARPLRQHREIVASEVGQHLPVPGIHRSGFQPFVGHDAVVPVGAAQMQVVGEMAPALGQPLAQDRPADARLLPLRRRQRIHQVEAAPLMILEQPQAGVAPGIGAGDLGAEESGREHHLPTDRQAVERQMMAEQLPAPGIGGRGFAEQAEGVAPFVEHAGRTQHLAEEGVEPHGAFARRIAGLAQAGAHHRHGESAHRRGGRLQAQAVFLDQHLGVLPLAPQGRADPVQRSRPFFRRQGVE